MSKEKLELSPEISKEIDNSIDSTQEPTTINLENNLFGIKKEAQRVSYLQENF